MPRTSQAGLKLIDLALIDDHPDNPRLILREEVVDGIAVSLRTVGIYPQQHALHVRPLGERYQILGGHHRKAAAGKSGLTQVWAWVEDLDDQQAHMALVLNNRQGELAPLEIGLHVLKAVPPAQGGRGREGGLSAYAKQIGWTHQYVSQLRAAAEVADVVKHATQVAGLLDRTKHLFEISSAHRDLWPALVTACLSLVPEQRTEDAADEWTVARTREAVRSVTKCLEAIPETWQESYLRPVDVVAEVVAKKTKPAFFGNLVRLATFVDELIRENADDLPDGCLETYHAWLKDNARGLSWDMRKLQDYRTTLEAILADGPEGLYNLILADPPWQYDFAETDNRQIENQYPTLDLEGVKSYLSTLRAQPAEDSVLFLWATAPKLCEALEVMAEWGFEYKTCAVWDKEVIGMGYWFRGQHELLLVGVKGSFSPPEPSVRVSSVIRSRRGQHSQKPEEMYTILERMFPDAKRLELFARGQREGWKCVGYEAGSESDGER